VALRALEHTAESSARWSIGITGLEVYQPSEKATEVSHYSNAAIVHEIVLFLGKQKGKNSPSSFKELKAVLASKQIYLGKQRLLQIVTRYRQVCGSGIISCRSGSRIFNRVQIRMPWLIMTHSCKKYIKSSLITDIVPFSTISNCLLLPVFRIRRIVFWPSASLIICPDPAPNPDPSINKQKKEENF
jgi:hypothetical protein